MLQTLASRKRCDLKTRKRCDFYPAAQKIASDFSAISSASFWRFFCDFCGKTCDLVLCDLKTLAIFLRLRFFWDAKLQTNALGRGVENRNFPNMVGRGCKMSLGPKEPKSPKSLLHYPKPVLQGCNPSLHQCKTFVALLA